MLEDVLHFGYRIGHGHVFSDTNDHPSSRNERCVDLTIALSITLKLGTPVTRDGLGLANAQRTHMPETPIHEDRHASPREDDISAHTPTRVIEPVVLPEAETSPVQSRSQKQLRRRVSVLDRTHIPGSARRRSCLPLGASHRHGAASQPSTRPLEIIGQDGTRRPSPSKETRA